MQKLHTDMVDKLAVKADLREVERSVPQKVRGGGRGGSYYCLSAWSHQIVMHLSCCVVCNQVDEVYRAVMGEVKGLQKDLARAATKEEFHVLLASKVCIVILTS